MLSLILAVASIPLGSAGLLVSILGIEAIAQAVVDYFAALEAG